VCFVFRFVRFFVFFFFWLCFLFAGTLFSIFKWLQAISNRKQFFKKLLSIANRKLQKQYSNAYSAPPGEKVPLIDAMSTNSSMTYESSNIKPPSNWDLRLILGLIQDHTGLLFCSRVYREITNLHEQRVREQNQGRLTNFHDAETIRAHKKTLAIEQPWEEPSDVKRVNTT